jgi:hypothetical protein
MVEGPAQTLNYMLAGYGVIFGIMFLYLASLVIRWRNLKQEEEILEQVESKKAKQPKNVKPVAGD